jgi:hypothetical protein
MRKRELFGMAALLALAMVFTGCEAAAGGKGAQGLPGATATTARGVKAYFDEGHKIVYVVGDIALPEGDVDSLTVPDGSSLILSDVNDLNSRAVSASGRGSITVKANGTLNVGVDNGTGTKLVVPNGTSVTVEAGTVALKGTPAVIVGTPGVIPAADAPKATFAIKGGTVTATGAATLAFTSGAKLDVTPTQGVAPATISGFTAAVFAFEDPAALNEAVVAAIKDSGSTKLDIGGTINTDGTVAEGTGTEIDPNSDVSFGSDAGAFLDDLAVTTKVLVSYTGAAPVTISAPIIANGTKRVIALTNPAATLTIAASGGSLKLGAADVINTAGGVIVNGTVDLDLRVTGSFWDAFTGTGLVTVNHGGSITQTTNYGIGDSTTSREFKFAAIADDAQIIYNGTGVTIKDKDTTNETAAVVTLGHALELTKPLTVATGATLDLAALTVVFRGTVPLTVNGTLKTSKTTSMWDAFDLTAAAGSVVINGSYLQGDATWGIGTGREFELGSGGKITWDNTNVTINGAVTAYAKGTGDVLEWTKDHIVASGATLTLGGTNVTLKAAPSTGTLKISAGATLVVPTSVTLTLADGEKLTIAPAGIVNVATGGALTVAASKTLSTAGTVNVAGTLTLNDNSAIALTGGDVVVKSGGTFAKPTGGNWGANTGGSLIIETGGTHTIAGNVWAGSSTDGLYQIGSGGKLSIIPPGTGHDYWAYAIDGAVSILKNDKAVDGNVGWAGSFYDALTVRNGAIFTVASTANGIYADDPAKPGIRGEGNGKIVLLGADREIGVDRNAVNIATVASRPALPGIALVDLHRGNQDSTGPWSDIDGFKTTATTSTTFTWDAAQSKWGVPAEVN